MEEWPIKPLLIRNWSFMNLAKYAWASPILKAMKNIKFFYSRQKSKATELLASNCINRRDLSVNLIGLNPTDHIASYWILRILTSAILISRYATLAGKITQPPYKWRQFGKLTEAIKQVLENKISQTFAVFYELWDHKTQIALVHHQFDMRVCVQSRRKWSTLSRLAHRAAALQRSRKFK